MKRTSGFTLIELLVSVAILAVITMGFMTFTANQQREIMRLNARYAAMDVNNLLRNMARSSPACVFNFGGPGRPFNSVGIPTSGNPLPNALLTYNVVRDGDTATSPVIVQVGAPLPTVNAAAIQQISMANWLRISNDEFRADLIVGYELGDLGAVRPIQITGMKLTTDPASPVSAKIITQCNAELLAGGGGGQVQQQQLIHTRTVSCCPRMMEMYSVGAFCWVRVSDASDKYDDWMIEAIVPSGGTYNFRGQNYNCP